MVATNTPWRARNQGCADEEGWFFLLALLKRGQKGNAKAKSALLLLLKEPSKNHPPLERAAMIPFLIGRDKSLVSS